MEQEEEEIFIDDTEIFEFRAVGDVVLSQENGWFPSINCIPKTVSFNNKFGLFLIIADNPPSFNLCKSSEMLEIMSSEDADHSNLFKILKRTQPNDCHSILSGGFTTDFLSIWATVKRNNPAAHSSHLLVSYELDSFFSSSSSFVSEHSKTGFGDHTSEISQVKWSPSSPHSLAPFQAAAIVDGSLYVVEVDSKTGSFQEPSPLFRCSDAERVVSVCWKSDVRVLCAALSDCSVLSFDCAKLNQLARIPPPPEHLLPANIPHTILSFLSVDGTKDVMVVGFAELEDEPGSSPVLFIKNDAWCLEKTTIEVSPFDDLSQREIPQLSFSSLSLALWSLSILTSNHSSDPTLFSMEDKLTVLLPSDEYRIQLPLVPPNDSDSFILSSALDITSLSSVPTNLAEYEESDTAKSFPVPVFAILTDTRYLCISRIVKTDSQKPHSFMVHQVHPIPPPRVPLPQQSTSHPFGSNQTPAGPSEQPSTSPPFGSSQTPVDPSEQPSTSQTLNTSLPNFDQSKVSPPSETNPFMFGKQHTSHAFNSGDPSESKPFPFGKQSTSPPFGAPASNPVPGGDKSGSKIAPAFPFGNISSPKVEEPTTSAFPFGNISSPKAPFNSGTKPTPSFNLPNPQSADQKDLATHVPDPPFGSSDIPPAQPSSTAGEWRPFSAATFPSKPGETVVGGEDKGKGTTPNPFDNSTPFPSSKSPAAPPFSSLPFGENSTSKSLSSSLMGSKPAADVGPLQPGKSIEGKEKPEGAPTHSGQLGAAQLKGSDKDSEKSDMLSYSSLSGPFGSHLRGSDEGKEKSSVFPGSQFPFQTGEGLKIAPSSFQTPQSTPPAPSEKLGELNSGLGMGKSKGLLHLQKFGETKVTESSGSLTSSPFLNPNTAPSTQSKESNQGTNGNFLSPSQTRQQTLFPNPTLGSADQQKKGGMQFPPKLAEGNAQSLVPTASSTRLQTTTPVTGDTKSEEGQSTRPFSFSADSSRPFSTSSFSQFPGLGNTATKRPQLFPTSPGDISKPGGTKEEQTKSISPKAPFSSATSTAQSSQPSLPAKKPPNLDTSLIQLKELANPKEADTVLPHASTDTEKKLVDQLTSFDEILQHLQGMKETLISTIEKLHSGKSKEKGDPFGLSEREAKRKELLSISNELSQEQDRIRDQISELGEGAVDMIGTTQYSFQMVQGEKVPQGIDDLNRLNSLDWETRTMRERLRERKLSLKDGIANLHDHVHQIHRQKGQYLGFSNRKQKHRERRNQTRSSKGPSFDTISRTIKTHQSFAKNKLSQTAALNERLDRLDSRSSFTPLHHSRRRPTTTPGRPTSEVSSTRMAHLKQILRGSPPRHSYSPQRPYSARFLDPNITAKKASTLPSSTSSPSPTPNLRTQRETPLFPSETTQDSRPLDTSQVPSSSTIQTTGQGKTATNLGMKPLSFSTKTLHESENKTQAFKSAESTNHSGISSFGDNFNMPKQNAQENAKNNAKKIDLPESKPEKEKITVGAPLPPMPTKVQRATTLAKSLPLSGTPSQSPKTSAPQETKSTIPTPFPTMPKEQGMAAAQTPIPLGVSSTPNKDSSSPATPKSAGAPMPPMPTKTQRETAKNLPLPGTLSNLPAQRISSTSFSGLGTEQQSLSGNSSLSAPPNLSNPSGVTNPSVTKSSPFSFSSFSSSLTPSAQSTPNSQSLVAPVIPVKPLETGSDRNQNPGDQVDNIDSRPQVTGNLPTSGTPFGSSFSSTTSPLGQFNVPPQQQQGSHLQQQGGGGPQFQQQLQHQLQPQQHQLQPQQHSHFGQHQSPTFGSTSTLASGLGAQPSFGSPSSLGSTTFGQQSSIVGATQPLGSTIGFSSPGSSTSFASLAQSTPSTGQSGFGQGGQSGGFSQSGGGFGQGGVAGFGQGGVAGFGQGGGAGFGQSGSFGSVQSRNFGSSQHTSPPETAMWSLRK